jgi:hypothetical protein
MGRPRGTTGDQSAQPGSSALSSGADCSWKLGDFARSECYRLPSVERRASNALRLATHAIGSEAGTAVARRTGPAGVVFEAGYGAKNISQAPPDRKSEAVREAACRTAGAFTSVAVGGLVSSKTSPWVGIPVGVAAGEATSGVCSGKVPVKKIPAAVADKVGEKLEPVKDALQDGARELIAGAARWAARQVGNFAKDVVKEGAKDVMELFPKPGDIFGSG